MTFSDELKKVCPDTKENEPMRLHTTFRIGGAADFFSSPSDISQLIASLTLCRENQVPYMILGNGSNMLVSDGGIEGVVIDLSASFTSIARDGCTLSADAGVLMPRLARFAMDGGLSGMEQISGIPGTLGGVVCMNAGAYGREIKDIITSVTYLDEDLSVKKASGDELGFGYRKSMFSDRNCIVLSAELALCPGDPKKIQSETAIYTEKRVSKQPLNLPSAGSVFKRPEGYFAGDLIERAGLKGFRIGGAEVSKKHAGFIVNADNASAADVIALIEHIQKTVKEKFSVALEPEIKLTGRR